MTSRSPVMRVLVALGLVCAAVVALASSIVLHGADLVVVLVAAAVAACLGYATQDAGRAARIALACRLAVGTVTIIILVTGLVVLVGGDGAALVIGLATVIGGALWLKTRLQRRARAGTTSASPVAGSPAPPASWKPPVSLLPTSDLCSEWLLTTSALARPVEPTARQDIIRRRQETLDELERRDPAGFAHWLAAGPSADSDPAVFVRGDRTTDSDAA